MARQVGSLTARLNFSDDRLAPFGQPTTDGCFLIARGRARLQTR
jgi:hypothetical protein